MRLFASGQSPWTDNKHAYRGISDSNTYYSCIGACLGSLSSRNPPPLFSVPWAQLSEFSSSCQISRLPLFLTGEMWEEECRICPLRLKEKKHTQTNNRTKKKEEREQKEEAGLWLFVLQLKMSSWPRNKSHGVVMCLFTVRCIAAIHTLIFSPGPPHAPPQHTQPFLLDQIHPALPPHSSLFHSLHWVCISLSIHKMPNRCLGSYTEHCIWTESLIR